MNIAFQNHLRECGGREFSSREGSVSEGFSKLSAYCSLWVWVYFTFPEKGLDLIELPISFFSSPLFPSQKRERPSREAVAHY